MTLKKGTLFYLPTQISTPLCPFHRKAGSVVLTAMVVCCDSGSMHLSSVCCS